MLIRDFLGTYFSFSRQWFVRWKERRGCILWILACTTFFAGCSTGRNTTGTRAYHELTTRYNIHFNAEEIYQEILKGQVENPQDNNGELLSFYPPLPDAEKSSPGGPFDPVIEKTGKAIKEHSIRAKPRRNTSKTHSQEYHQWLAQEEFNPFIKNVWLLRGKAYLQNGDYNEALSVFSGMLRQFSHDPELVTETEIWMLRTYTEMGRRYDAEKTAYSLRNKKLTTYLDRLLTEHYTHFLIRNKEFVEAIPFLQKTITQEPDHLRKKRLQFLLGQIYAITGDKSKAYLAFEEVKGIRTPTQLTHDATLWQSAIANDSLAQLLQPSQRDKDTTHQTTRMTVTTDSISGNIKDINNSTSRFSPGRTMAENATLHRQWRSRNGLWQSSPVSSSKGKNEEESRFSADKSGVHFLLLTFAPHSVNKNQLLFSITDFNFSHFKLRKFNVSYSYLGGKEMLQIEPFRSFGEASQYAEMMHSDTLFLSTIPEVIPIIISEKNMEFIRSGKSIDEYNIFYAENMGGSAFPAPIIKDEIAEIGEKNRQESEKIVSLKEPPFLIPEQREIDTQPLTADQTEQDTIRKKPGWKEPAHQMERETPEALKRRLEINAANVLQQQQEMMPGKSRQQILKEREKQRKEKIRQRERELKERQRQREDVLKQREKERAQKIRKQK